MKIDPICKMEVDEKDAIASEYKGIVYYFCSEGCREKFLSKHPVNANRSSYELIIIGGGPAGLTAALYATTLKLESFIITRDLGGQASDSTKVENYMGYDFITGPELIKKFQSQVIHSHYVDHLITEIEKIEPYNNGFRVTTSDAHEYHSKVIIIATGMTRRKLNIPGEEKFQRKGVFYGNIQDYSFIQGENVAVIGGGNSALQIVENLHTIAKNIYLISEYELTADPSVIEHVDSYKNLKKYENTKVIEFIGDKNISGVKIRKRATTETVEIPVKGVFISIGFQPNTGLVRSLVDLNKKQEIIIGHDCSTSFPGIFAAGDATNAFGKRIIIACGEGAKAALSARKYILNLRK